jgi:predicted DNA-binding protein
MGHQRLSRALSGTQWHSPAAVVVEPYLAKEIARGVVYLERLILGVCVVEDFEPEGVPDEGGTQRRGLPRISSPKAYLMREAIKRGNQRISSPKAYLMREAIKGGNQRISSPKAYLMREAIKGGNQRGTHRNSGS